jgi:type I restriction enzyme S subunit
MRSDEMKNITRHPVIPCHDTESNITVIPCNDTESNIPKLRFPEFLDDGEWEEKPLKRLAQNLDNKRVPITSSSRSQGDIPYYGASGIVDFVNDYIFDEELLCISEDGANLMARTYPIAFSISGKTWVNNHAHVLKFQNKCTQIIVENYLNSIKLDDFLTGMAQPKLNKAMLDIIPIPISPSTEEQQKIADCLSSIDNLITAQSKKLQTFKEHKKALMQQLFPQDGEKVPKLRFPEFLDDGEWEEKHLEELCKFQQGVQVDLELQSQTPKKNFVKFLRIENYTQKSNDFRYIPLELSGNKTIDVDEIAIVRYGATAGYIGRGLEGVLANNLFKLIPNKEILNPNYLFYFLTREQTFKFFQAEMSGGAMPALSFGIVGFLKVPFSSIQEQQKIANFLSSIDELITSSTKKVETLKEHKKGLMQQLFPSKEVQQ